MTFYHVTTEEAAQAILRQGFRDVTGYYGFPMPLTGVWLSDEPLTEHEGCKGDTVLCIELTLPEDVLNFHEVVGEGGTYREWLFPAQLLNEKGVASLWQETDDAEGNHQE